MTIHIAYATDLDGEAIRVLVAGSGFAPETINALDWSKLGAYWLKAVRDDEIIGCVQIAYALPISRLEYLSVGDVSDITRAKVVKQLLSTGCAFLSEGGAQIVSGTVPFPLKSYKRVLKKRGAVMTVQGNVFIKRIT